MVNELNVLLNKIRLILHEEQLLREEKDKRGENFNIFEIMKAQYDEVNTHSAFIASLLDPKGKHGGGKVFLETFINILRQYQKLDTETSTFFHDAPEVRPFIEYNIGNTSYDYESGGRIDILLESVADQKRKAIIIENKIYAADQKKQLYRYKAYANNKYGKGNFIILYLTLDGHSPSETSTRGEKYVLNEDADYFCISYKEHIIKWLNICKEKAASVPTVRETITQYINLILNITHRNMEDIPREKLIELLATKDNYLTVFKIQEIYTDVIKKICKSELNKQIKDLAEEMKLHCIIPDNWGERYCHFFFSKENWKYFHIGFEFMGKDFNNWIYGIEHIKEDDITNNDIELLSIKKDLIETVNFKDNSNWWPCYAPFTPNNLNTAESIEQIYNGCIKNNIKCCITQLLSAITPIEEKYGHI